MAAINIYPIYDSSQDLLQEIRPVIPVLPAENIPAILIDGYDIAQEYGVYPADGSYAKILQFPNSKGVQYNEWDEHSGLDVDFNRVLLPASKTFDLTFYCKKSQYDSFEAFHSFMTASATHTLTYFGASATDAFPPITLRIVTPKVNYVSEFQELATQHSITYTFTIDKPTIPVNVMSMTWDSNASRYRAAFSLNPAWLDSDVIDQQTGNHLKYNGQPFYIGRSVTNGGVALINSLRYGVCLLRGTSLSVQGKPSLKTSYDITSEFSAGQTIRALTSTAGYSITLNCLLRAPSRLIFWINYQALLWELFRGLVPTEYTGGVSDGDTTENLFGFWQYIRLDIGYKKTLQLQCYYESCNSKKFHIQKNGNYTQIYWDFSLTFKVYNTPTLV